MAPTIFALSTPPGVSAISIVRISGPDSFKAVDRLCRSSKTRIFESRRASLRKVFSTDGKVLDEGLILCFEKGKSFTGEDMVELHLHGSPIVVKTVLEALSDLSYTRHAEAGEFTRKALENNKLNLFEAEGLADLLVAETEAQQSLALKTYTGAVSKKIEDWKKTIKRMLSTVEATIDFSDELDNIDFIHSIRSDLELLEKELIAEEEGYKAAESIREGFEVAFVGKPNVGKSTLLNRLADRKLAITSDISGTTRDIIELKFNLEGIPVTFLDTAGVRYGKNQIEKIGIENSIDRANKSDIRVFLKDEKENIEIYGVKFFDSDIVLRPKGDLPGLEPSISGKTGKGIDFMLEKIKQKLGNKIRGASSITRIRHLEKVSQSIGSLRIIRDEMGGSRYEPEIIAEECRNMLRYFDGLLGLVDTEDILGEIFAKFCIGK